MTNGSLEAGDLKPTGWGLPAGITWEQESGNRFLRFSANGKMVMIYKEIPLGDRKALQLAFRARHQGIKPGTRAWFDGRVMLKFQDAERKEIPGGPPPSAFRGTAADWTEKTLRFAVPEGATTLVFMPCLFNAAEGTLDLDDFSLTGIDPASLGDGTPKAVDDPALPQAIAPGDPRLRYAGRWDLRDAAGPRSEWPATQVHLVLDGTAINAVLAGPQAFEVLVDGVPVRTVTVRPGQSVYSLAADLAPGRHRIELCKRSEAWGGPVQVKGFQIPAAAKLLDPPAFARRILFIGDSITAGYGNEAKSKDEHFTQATENASAAWGALTARALQADLTCLAVSGIWLQENDAGKPPMPAIWNRTMPFSDGGPWDGGRWQADAVVVNLGTNDITRPIDKRAWRDAYIAFIGQIRATFPAAHVFLAIGPMGHGPGGIIATANAEIAAELGIAGDAKIHALALANQDPANGIGADWHPSVKTHRLMAETMTAAIRTQLGWQAAAP